MAFSFVLGAAVLLSATQPPTDQSRAVRLAFPVIFLLTFVALWVCAQALLPSLHPSWDLKATEFHFLKTLMMLTIFVLTLYLVQTRRQLELLCWILVVGGVVQVLIKVFWGVDGTYYNYSHFAGYLEMALGVGFGLMISRLNPQGKVSWRESVRRWVKTLLGPKVIIRILIIVLVIGLILSRSRMGNTAFFGAMFIAGMIGLFTFRRMNRSVVIFFVSILVIDVVLMGAFFGIDKLQQRFEQLNVEQDGRVFLTDAAIDIVGEYPLTGTGGGTFYAVYPSFRAEQRAGISMHAHNDFVQFPAELGIPAAFALALCVVHSLVTAIRVQITRNSQFMKAMGFGATMGILAILIHSSADFNLQLTSNAGIFMVLLAIPYLAWSIDRRTSSSNAG